MTVEFRDTFHGAPDADVIVLTSDSAVVGDRRVPKSERVRRARQFTRALKSRGIALVRTAADEGTPRPVTDVEAILHQATNAYLTTSPAVATPGGAPSTVVAHSHFRGRFLGFPRADTVTGRLLFLSPNVLPAAYEPPLKVFSAAAPAGWTLRVVGRIPQALSSSFARTISRNPATVSLRSELMSDASLVEEVSQAELVAVADPRSQESTSVVLLALSLDRPVLVEDTPAMRALAAEVGSTWVRLHHGPLTVTTLERELARMREAPPAGTPDLDARDPNSIAAQYATALRAAAASV